mgnify:FL=1
MQNSLDTENYLKAMALYDAREFYRKLLDLEEDEEDFDKNLQANFLAYITVFIQKKKKPLRLLEFHTVFMKKREKFIQDKAATGLDTVYYTTKQKLFIRTKNFIDRLILACKPFEVPHFYQEAKKRLKNKEK